MSMVVLYRQVSDFTKIYSCNNWCRQVAQCLRWAAVVEVECVAVVVVELHRWQRQQRVLVSTRYKVEMQRKIVAGADYAAAGGAMRGGMSDPYASVAPEYNAYGGYNNAMSAYAPPAGAPSTTQVFWQNE